MTKTWKIFSLLQHFPDNSAEMSIVISRKSEPIRANWFNYPWVTLQCNINRKEDFLIGKVGLVITIIPTFKIDFMSACPGFILDGVIFKRDFFIQPFCVGHSVANFPSFFFFLAYLGFIVDGDISLKRNSFNINIQLIFDTEIQKKLVDQGKIGIFSWQHFSWHQSPIDAIQSFKTEPTTIKSFHIFVMISVKKDFGARCHQNWLFELFFGMP